MTDTKHVALKALVMTTEHEHRWMHFHADFCHRYEMGMVCDCGKKRAVESEARDFSSPDSAWWHWGREGCAKCEDLMIAAGLDPRALGDEDLACREIDRQFANVR